MDPAERGTLIHDVLERFFRDRQAEGRPQVMEAWDAADSERLVELARKELARAGARGQTGLGIYAQHEARTIEADLRRFLLHDTQFRRRTGAVPTDFEAEVPPKEIAGVTLRGRIDRIDRTPDGLSAWVIDYKTGSAYDADQMRKDGDYLQGGRKLQLPVYLEAAADAKDARAVYWYITQKGGFDRLEYPNTPQNRTRFEATLTAILAAIRAGSFPAVPDEEDEFRGGFKNCGWCDFDRICSRRRDLEFQAKASDPAVHPWSGVREASAHA
jgi:RecB family exonuclease